MAAWWVAALATAAMGTPAGADAGTDGGVAELHAGAEPTSTGLGFGPGEALSYAVTYFGAAAGSARIEVGSAAQRGGVTTWPVVVNATSAGVAEKIFVVRDRYVDWWDPATGRSVESGLWALEGGHRSGFRIRFERHRSGPDGGVAAETDYWEGAEHQTGLRAVEPDAQDILSAVFWLRTQRLAVGDRYMVPIFMGKVQWPLGATVLAKETVSTPLGPFACVHVRLSASFKGKLGNRRDLDAYFSDDRRHLPVVLDSEVVIGHLRVSLTGVLGNPAAVSH